MLSGSFVVDGTMTLQVYRKLFADPGRYLDSVANTLTLAALTATGACGLGLALGLLLAKTDLPLRRAFAVLLAVPLLIPPYILAICWSDLLAPNGLLGRVLAASLAARLTDSLYALPGCVWIMVSALMPFVMIVTCVCVRTLDAKLEEAARLTTGWGRTLRYVTLPMIEPAIVFAALIVFLLAAGEAGVPMLLRYSVYSMEALVQFAAFYDFAAAAATAIPLLALAVALLILEHRYLHERTYRLLAATPRSKRLIVPLRRWRIPAMLGVALVAAGSVLVPLGALLDTSLSPSGYRAAWLHTADSWGRSVWLAVVGATLLTGVGFACGYLIQRRAERWWRAVDMLTLLLFTVPGTVIGVGMIALWNHRATGFVYASTAMLVLAYLAQYSALTTRISVAMLANVPCSLEDAARISGAPWFARIARIVLPAALPGVIAAWAVAFIFCLRDVGASMLLYPAGADTLPVRIFTLMANGAPNMIAAACVSLIMIDFAMLAAFAAALHLWSKHRCMRSS